jgi:hypothetical protein
MSLSHWIKNQQDKKKIGSIKKILPILKNSLIGYFMLYDLL